MGQNTRWRISDQDGNEIATTDHEPFAIYRARAGFVVLTKEPFFDEATQKPGETPREHQVLDPKPKPKKKGKKKVSVR